VRKDDDDAITHNYLHMHDGVMATGDVTGLHDVIGIHEVTGLYTAISRYIKSAYTKFGVNKTFGTCESSK
jgi:hypothetical protein